MVDGTNKRPQPQEQANPSETFFDFYESKGWMVGKNKMKDWKACVRTWEKRQNKTNNNNNTTSHKHKAGGDYGDGKF